MTDKCIITSYTNPDTDGIGCMLGLSRLLSKQGIECIMHIDGSLNEESRLVLKTAGIGTEVFSSEDLPQKGEIVLVDTHNRSQVKFIDDLDRVVEIIDHHPDGDESDFPNARITNMKIGAAASIVADRCLREMQVDEALAFVLGCAIISNTNNFTAPSTSEYDRRVFGRLCGICRISDDFIRQMKVSLDLEILGNLGKSIIRETKSFSMDGTDISVSQLELQSGVDDDLLSRMTIEFEKVSGETPYLLSVVDYSNNRTIFFRNSEGSSIMDKLFGTSENILIRNEILLRKTFVLPRLKKKEKRIGVIHGRFQGLHNGHMEYLLAGKSRCDFLYVGITNFSRETGEGHRLVKDSNPFTYLQRMEMIEGSLTEAGVPPDSFKVIPFPIEHPEQLEEFAPRDATYFVTIYDEWGVKKQEILSDLGLKTDVMWSRTMSDRLTSGTEVRELIAGGKEWKHLVPPFVYRYITERKLDDALRDPQ